MSESGDNKLLGNFRKLIDEVSAQPEYNPGSNKLKVTALNAQFIAADAAVTAVEAAHAPYKLAITDRESAFKEVRPMVVRSRNYLKASGAPKGVVERCGDVCSQVNRQSQDAKDQNWTSHSGRRFQPAAGAGGEKRLCFAAEL